MLRISALNEELSEESSGVDEPLVPTKEVEEAESLNLYKEALDLRQKNELDAALKLFHQTLALSCIENASLDEKEDEGNRDLATLSSCLQIKYACLKNIGALCASKGDFDEALEAYLEAVEVDPLDVTVWHNIGKISMTLKNFQLARHAFLQGLACSPNHWPCLDGIISVLFGLGDDISCLHYINIALGKDAFYTRGLILRDSIFQVSPSLREDVERMFKEKWVHLFETCPYSEEEKKEFMDEAERLRQDVGGLYTEVVLPGTPLAKKIDALTWIAVGESLLATYKTMSDNNKPLIMSCPIELELPKEKEEIGKISVNPPSSSNSVEMMECSDIQADTVAEKNASHVDDAPHSKELPRQNSILEEVAKSDVDGPSDPPLKGEPVTKPESRKRKRSVENGVSVSEKEIQRRSTRSRAYAQQVEEDIYSLRAELRSFLPTCLLLDENFDMSKEAKTDHTGMPTLKCCDNLPDAIPLSEEQKTVSAFIHEAQESKMRIVEILERFCTCVTQLEGFLWPKELSNVFKDAYQIVRNGLPVSDVFHQENKPHDELSDFEVLIHAEILVSCQKNDPNMPIPSWFIEDLMYLFQCADPIDTQPKHSKNFQARVFWLHCNWHFQNGNVEVALNYLQMVSNCFKPQIRGVSQPHALSSVVTHSVDKPIILSVSDCNEMGEVLFRTLQLKDVVKLYENKKFKQLVNILKATFITSESEFCNHKYRVPVDRPTQINMLLEGLSALEDFDDYLVWSEKSLDESTSQYLEAYNRKNVEEGATADQPVGVMAASDWSKVIEKISTEIEEILRFKRTSLSVLSRRALVRFAENLVLICSHQLEAPDASCKMPLSSPIFWVLLHRVIEFEEQRIALVKKEERAAQNVQNAMQNESEEEVDEALPCSILFLLSAHDLLGKHSWCMLEGGVFALYLLEVLMKKRRVTQDYEDREELGRAIEQSSFCALGYPTNKKSKTRSLADHSVTPVSLTWNRVLLLAEFFLPVRQDLPEFDTVKPTSNAEQEMLLQKVSSLIPPELDPRNRLEDIQSFIQGQRPDIPKYLNHSGVPQEVENVFYLLGDYYFKNKDWTKAIENYILDLALVPDRFDSWAAVALAIASRLETKLNSCERLKNLATFLDRAEAALRCFRRALVLRPLQTTLWIEQGSTAYMLHSFCSQLLRNETDSLSIEMFERLEKEKDRMLDIAHDCFVAADKASLSGIKKGNGDDQDERWLHHYMLGKVAEKRSKPFSELIEHYQYAAKLLEESSASYPRRIPYNTPPQLSVEALEIHYRIHSHCLKTLMSFEGRPQDIAAYFGISKQLQMASSGAFAHGGRRVSIEQKEEILEKETKKRKASKHEEEKPTKKTNVDPDPEVKLEGRAATIYDVSIILNEILDQAIRIAKPKSDAVKNDVILEPPAQSEREKDTLSIPIASGTCGDVEMDIEPSKTISELPPQSQTNESSSSSSSDDSSDSDSDSDSSSSSDSSDGKKDGKEIENQRVANLHGDEPVPELQAMVDICLAAIKECVGRFPHFYKGLYRLAHYYYHSKVNRNIDACRELLFGRPISASIAQLQQQQGVAQARHLPTGVAGLFTEWRSNNFFHGIWRIPINEIDRPGCFASHMGRSAALLLDVLRETRDHRLLMELALALQPEPEPDKKYLFDSEREQHASLALSLMGQVLRSRLQEVRDSANVILSGSDDPKHPSPQQGSPSSSKKLSLLMDTFRAYDRIERNLPGQEVIFGALLIEGFKIYRGARDQNESDTNMMEQALAFCRNKQAQSRARVGGVRGGMASSLGVVSSRGKRAYTTNRRGRPPGVSRPTVKDLINTSTLPVQTAPSSSSGQSNANVMQEAMKLLQSAGGSINNLPQHLKNIPGISNLLALFSNPTGDKASAETPAPAAPPPRPVPKKESSTPKPVPPAVPAAVASASQPVPQTSSMYNPLLHSLASVGGPSSTPASLAGLGMMDPALLSMFSNPYLNPMSMFGIGGPMGAADASSMSKMQQDYQQQLANWMQASLAQSYVLSNMTSPYFASQRGRGRGNRKSSSSRHSSKTYSGSTESKTNLSGTGEASGSGMANTTRTSTPDSSSRNKPLDFMRRSDSTEGSKSIGKSTENRTSSAAKFPNDFKLPPPLFDSSMMRQPNQQDPNMQHKSVHSAEAHKKKPHSSSHSSGRPHKKAITTPTIDVSKLIAGFSPAFDMGRMGKMETKTKDSSSSSRGKTPKVSSDLHPPPYPSKPSYSKPMGHKEATAPPPFPNISLGRDITVTATSASSKPIVSQPNFLGSSSSTGRVKQSHFSQPSPHSYAGVASTSQQIAHASSIGRSDPHNIAFSVLQNLPSSMSLLVKPNSASHTKHTSKTQTGPIDLVVNKSNQQSTNPIAPLPKLTPAPKFQGNKKGIPSQAPPLSLKAVSSASPIPPFLSNVSSSQSTSQIGVPRNLSNQKPLEKTIKAPEKDSGDDSDVVVLD